MPPAFMLNSKKMKTSGTYHIVLIVILFILLLETSLRRKHICNTRIISYRHIQRLVYIGMVVYDGVCGDSFYFLVIKRLYIARLQG